MFYGVFFAAPGGPGGPGVWCLPGPGGATGST